MSKAPKDLLFFSKFCDHCTEVTTRIVKMNMRELFMFICIDDPKVLAQMPKIIDRVPTILTKDKRILTDEYVMRYLDSHHKPAADAVISPFSLLTGNAMSEQYSYLEDSTNNEIPVDSLQNFTLIGSDNRIMAADQSENNKDKFNSSVLDNYIANRNLDDENIKRVLTNQNFDRTI